MSDWGYTGNWQRTQFYSVPGPEHIIDPAHDVPGQKPEQAVDWTSPPLSLPPAVDVYTDDTDDAVVVSEGLVLDQTDAHDHLSAGDHETDLGSPRANHWNEPPIKGPGERYEARQWEDFGPENMQVTEEALRQGTNSAPQNNPPLEMYFGKGFRYGTREFYERGRNRKYLSRVIRTDHGVHPLRPNTAHVPPPSHYERAVPLWKSFARMVDKVEKKTMIRRTPPAIGEVVVDDGGPSPEDAFSVIESGF